MPTFGTPTAQAQPSFGAVAPQTQPTFGASLGQISASQPSTTNFQFGGTTTSTAAPSLFSSQPSTLNFKSGGFGAPTSQPTSLFGATSGTTSTGFGLGVPGATTTSTGLSFGAPTSTTGGLTLGLGAPATTTATNLSFGAPATSASAGLSFGTTQPSSLFGSAPATTSAPTLGLSFGTSTSSTIPTLGLGTSTTSSGGLTLGLGGTAAVTSAGSTSLFGLGGTATTTATLATTTTASVGLGGIETTQTKVVTTQKEVPPKEQPLPNEILQTVEQFKEMVKQQKMFSSDIARCSVREFRKVEQEIDHLMNLLSDVESQLLKNRHLAEKLKYDTAKCLQNVEMAQRTQDTPPGLQYENTAPLKFFMELADQFEREMQVLKYQIESADNYVKNHRSPDALTPQDLALGMRRLHETFVALAGRLQSVHSQVEAQKEHYISLRKQLFHDNSNPFEKIAAESNVTVKTPTYNLPKVATGPTPFSNLTLGTGSYIITQQSQSSAASGFGSSGQTGF
ncbi:unnamed protein product [Callosobruchus maculatus]|nr:unnamed protein product [Callosobruchus maculatus]